MDQTYVIEPYDITSSSMVIENNNTNNTNNTNTNNKSSIRWSKFLSSTLSSSGGLENHHQMDCACCNERLLLNDMQSYYRFKINGEHDWFYLDASCYDRLLAVCQFFNYLNQIHDQLSSTSFENQDMYHSIFMDLFNFKLSMFYARLGVKKSSSSLLSHDSDSDSTVSSTNGPLTPITCLSRRMSYQVSDGK
ncbi:unnamed protein product [Cunninghamella blakesleeana]